MKARTLYLFLLLASLTAFDARALTLGDGTVVWYFQVTGNGQVVDGSLSFAPIGSSIVVDLRNPVSGVSSTTAGPSPYFLPGIPVSTAVLDTATIDDVIASTVWAEGVLEVFGGSSTIFAPGYGSSLEIRLQDTDGDVFTSDSGSVAPPSDPPPLALFEVATFTVRYSRVVAGGSVLPAQISYAITALPEPQSLSLLASLALLALARRRG